MRDEDRSERFHVAIVHVGEQCRRRLGKRLDHVARLLERGVRLVHVDERQLRRQEKRPDSLTQGGDLIRGHDPIGGGVQNYSDAVVVGRVRDDAGSLHRHTGRQVLEHATEIAVAAE